MERKKGLTKSLALLLILSLLVGNVSSFAYAAEEVEISSCGQGVESVIEEISMEDLYNDPELKALMEENDGYRILEDTKQEALENYYSAMANSAELYEDDIIITEEDIKSVIKEFGLEESFEETIDFDEELFVLRDAETRGISVWAITYVPDKSGLSVYVADVGSDVLDQVTFDVSLYTLNNTTWSYKSRAGFDKLAVGNGLAYRWNIGIDKVEEKFEYTTKVKNGSTLKEFTNVGDDSKKKVRYNFVAGPFNKLTANGVQRHHFVSASALSSTGYNSNSACAIRMITTDHYKTPSYGNSNVVSNERNMITQKKFKELLEMEVAGLSGQPDPEKLFSNLYVKYKEEVVICLTMYKALFGI